MSAAMQDGAVPLVSVIVPTHNRSALLIRAAESVLSQTFRDLELLIADDASQDDTPDCCRRLMESDSRVRLVRGDVNVGAAAIRNRAIEQSRGRYICFLDDDDEWYESKLEKQLPLIERYSIVACRSRRVDGFVIAGVAEVGRASAQESHATGEANVTEVTLGDIFFNNGRMSPSCVMVKRQHLLEIGGFDETLPSSQGRDLFVRLVHRFGNAALMYEYLAKHFQRHGLPRITTSAKSLVGGWMELDKHRHLMSHRQRKWRSYVLCIKQAELASSWLGRMRWIGRAFRFLQPWRIGSHVRVFASQLVVR